VSGTLIFDTPTVRKLVDHAKGSTEHRATYGHKAEPALLLVGDQGVYLMSSGIPHLPLPDGKSDSSLVAYAKGTNPSGSDDDWYENKRALYGGDDGADALPLAGLEDALVACEAAGVAFKIRLSPSSISVLAPAAPKRKTGAGIVAKLEAASAAVKAGLTVTLDEHEPPVVVASLREAALVCSRYRDEHNLGGRDWSGGDVKLGGKLVARVSYNGRVWDLKGKPVEGDALDKLPAKAPARKRKPKATAK